MGAVGSSAAWGKRILGILARQIRGPGGWRHDFDSEPYADRILGNPVLLFET